ncbi:hypothetical protein [Marilutibacter alkalisoli]|uniref:DUF2306 domain-containing protein n=1 Tax=Marilutibacter alkalisoli TaxID=2591633 RepID=A0A514BUS3_9GAMM|nr:hypothetical protein [Lysobacter alkalisoli]QDH71151.1 hypothetical protein FKV23_14440 [Lysobacter alkalisoli]
MTRAVDALARTGDRTRRGLPLDSLALALVIAVATLWPLVLWAFWPRYLSRLTEADGYTHAHAMLGMAWLLLLAAQPLLMRARRFAAHRRLGRMGMALGAAFVVSGVLSAHRLITRMDEAQFARDGFFLYMILATTTIFAAALLLGVIWRKSPAVHGRFMACTLLPLLDPVLARILGFHFPPLPAEFMYQLPAVLVTAVLLALLTVTLPRGTPGRRPFVWFAVGSMVLLLLHFASQYSRTWLTFVEWFRSLPIT